MQPLYKIYTVNIAFTLCRRSRIPNSILRHSSSLVAINRCNLGPSNCFVSHFYPVPLIARIAGDAGPDPVSFFVLRVNGKG